MKRRIFSTLLVAAACVTIFACGCTRPNEAGSAPAAAGRPTTETSASGQPQSQMTEQSLRQQKKGD